MTPPSKYAHLAVVGERMQADRRAAEEAELERDRQRRAENYAGVLRALQACMSPAAPTAPAPPAPAAMTAEALAQAIVAAGARARGEDDGVPCDQFGEPLPADSLAAQIVAAAAKARGS